MSNLWLNESPMTMIEGETVTFSVTWLGATDVSSPGATVYKNGADVTSTVMPSGAHSASGNVQALKPMAAGSNDGGNAYVVVVQAAVDGNTERRKLLVKVLKASEE